MQAVGFPKELQNEIDVSLPAFISSTTVKVAPSNTSVVGPATVVIPGASSTVLPWNGLSQNVLFDLPAGNKTQFVDPRFTTLSFRVRYQISTAIVGAATASAYLRSSASSFWDRAYIQSQDGTILEDINMYGLVADTLLQLETDIAQRDAVAMMYGLLHEATGVASQNNCQGHQIPLFTGAPAAVGSEYRSYCVPLISGLIGKGASKMFQIGATSRLQLIMQSSALEPITIILPSASAGAVSITIDNIALNLQYIDIGTEGLRMLNKTGPQYYSGLTYRVSSATLSAGAANQVQILTGTRGSSVRNIITRITENAATTAVANCVNGFYDSKLPVATTCAYQINGLQIPSNPVDLVHNPATAFAFLQECNGAFDNYQMKSSITPDRYCNYIVGPTLPSDVDYNINSSTSSSVSQSSFMFGYNLEKVSKFGILDGMNCNSGQTYLMLSLVGGSTNALTFYFVSKLDCIWILDTATGSVSVRL